MEDKYSRAVDKLRDEMAGSKSRYVQVVGEYLTDYLQRHPDAADAILAKGKTVKGSLDAMRKEAEKHKEGGIAVLDDAAGFAIVLKYFGIEGGETMGEPQTSAEAAPISTPHSPLSTLNTTPPATEGVYDSFDLDALMGVL